MRNKLDDAPFRCTYCRGVRFMAGPRGGMSQNFTCANPACRHRFNDQGPFGIDDLRLVDNPFPDEVTFEERMHYAAQPTPAQPTPAQLWWRKIVSWLSAGRS